MFLGSLAVLGAPEGASLRGVLLLDPAGHPALKTPDGKTVLLEGDSQTIAVLLDQRLRGRQFEVIGKPVAADRFEIGPIHRKSMWVHQNGKRLLITYWCEVCAIRTYVPGKCQCCQEETELDLKDPNER
jgi:hypothetical protein